MSVGKGSTLLRTLAPLLETLSPTKPLVHSFKPHFWLGPSSIQSVFPAWRLGKVPDSVSKVRFGNNTNSVGPTASFQYLANDGRMVPELNRCRIEGLAEDYSKGFHVLSASQALFPHCFAQRYLGMNFS
jgi:hypothetical protein